jgi:hypothetical protein
MIAWKSVEGSGLESLLFSRSAPARSPSGNTWTVHVPVTCAASDGYTVHRLFCSTVADPTGAVCHGVASSMASDRVCVLIA